MCWEPFGSKLQNSLCGAYSMTLLVHTGLNLVQGGYSIKEITFFAPGLPHWVSSLSFTICFAAGHMVNHSSILKTCPHDDDWIFLSVSSHLKDVHMMIVLRFVRLKRDLHPNPPGWSCDGKVPWCSSWTGGSLAPHPLKKQSFDILMSMNIFNWQFDNSTCLKSRSCLKRTWQMQTLENMLFLGPPRCSGAW